MAKTPTHSPSPGVLPQTHPRQGSRARVPPVRRGTAPARVTGATPTILHFLIPRNPNRLSGLQKIVTGPTIFLYSR